jgi:ParB family chromosome partitioning protein
MTEVLEIETDKIESNPYQPRRAFDETKIRDLASSIERVGLLNPVLVRKKSEGYQLVHGERRFRAFKLLQKRTILAVVREVSDKELAVFSLIENMQREDLNPIDEALCYKRMIDELAFTHEEIADTINKDRTYITNRLRLLGLPEDIQEKVRRLTLTPGHAETLLKYQQLLDESKDIPLYPSRAPESVNARRPETALKSIATKIENGNLSVKDLREQVHSFERYVQGAKTIYEARSQTIKEARNIVPEKYVPAIERGEIEYQNGSLILRVTDKEFTNQEKRYPKYSFQQEIFVEDQKDVAQYPLFTETEWQEISEYYDRHEEILHRLFPDFSVIHDEPKVKENRLNGRTYDSSYGDFFYEWDEKPDVLAYVKKGWGRWVVIEFNFGDGKRTRRRFFRYDWAGPSLVNQAIQTAHPDMFSDFKYRELNIHKIHKLEMSWFYVRYSTTPRKDAIEALKKDLAFLENQESLTNEQIMEKAKIILNQIFEDISKQKWRECPDRFREGTMTFKQEVEADE